MDTPILKDKEQIPTEEIIFSFIGKTKTIWESLFEYIREEYPEFAEEWRYYNDGKSWLMKVTRKKKTILWLSVFKNVFKITFYFGDKAEPLIMESKLTDELKQMFKEGKKHGKIRGLTLVMNSKKNLKNARELISIKLKVK